MTNARSNSKTVSPPRQIRQGGLLYKDVADELRRRIAEGTYAPGSRVPSLHELVAEFGVSTITVRRALRELTYEGLLQSQQGVGVFIRPRPKIHRLLAGEPDSSIGDEIRRAGFEPAFEERSFKKIKADARNAERLRIPRGSAIYRHEKVTAVNNEVVSFHSLFIPPDIALELRGGFRKQFIFQLLRDRGISFVSSRFEFGSAVIDQELSPIFRLPVGFPLLQVHYTPVREDGSPVLTGMTSCRADMFVFEVDLPPLSKRNSGSKEHGRLASP
jgi:DNA-binding GntR family transcriptional regulator